MIIVSCVVVGIALGGLFGVLLWSLLAPERSERHEWYGMVLLLNLMWSAFGGGILGMVAGSLPTRYTIACASVGLLVGLAVGVVAWDQGALVGKERDPYFAEIIIWFTFVLASLGGIVGGTWSIVREPAANSPTMPATPRLPIAPFLVACTLALSLWVLVLMYCFRAWFGNSH
jgi:hypothetical protein